MVLRLQAAIAGVAVSLFSWFAPPAQTVQTAQQHVRLHVYGLFSYTRPNFLLYPNAHGVGVSAGGVLDGIRVLPFTDVGLEVRGVAAHSYDINEASVAGGPRIIFSRYRLQPYAEYMLGLGRGSFNHPEFDDYLRDYSAIRSYGGGFTYGVTRNWDLQADVQAQRWRFSYLLPYFHPVQASVGASYRIHFSSRTGPR